MSITGKLFQSWSETACTLILPVWYIHVTSEFVLCDTHVNDTKLAVIKH